MPGMFRCLNCGEVIRIESGSCRYCGVAVDPAAAARAEVELERVNTAVSLANVSKFAGLPAGAVVLLLAYFVAVLPERIPVFALVAQATPAIGLVSTLGWIRRYGALDTVDRDYPEAVRGMMRSAWVWFGAIVLQALLFAVLVARLVSGSGVA